MSSTPDHLIPEDQKQPELNPDQAPDPARLVAAEISQIAEPDDPLPMATLESLPEPLKEAMARAGWQSLMPVQAMAVPYLLAGRDIMVQSRTGSGKTGAFLLPALLRLDPEQKACQTLILVPTRELALQVAMTAETLLAGTGLTAAAVYGGVSYAKQAEAIRAGAQILVGTPGRVLDHLISRTLSLDHLRMLIFDEADRMLSVGFYQDMKDIQRYLPHRQGAAATGQRRRPAERGEKAFGKAPDCLSVHFFSATFPGYVVSMAGEFMDKPALLSLSHNSVHISQIEHVWYPCKPMEKDRVLVRVLEAESPTAAIIFCNTKANVHYVTGLLQGFGYNASELSADLTQAKREEVLQAVRRGEVRFLVATDVAARGIDIPEVSHVVLYEPPEDKEAYIHRAGRTGRAGAGGTAISLVDIMQKMDLDRIAKFYKIDIQERRVPSEEEIASLVAERLTSLLEGRLRGRTKLQKERQERFMPLVKRLAEEEATRPLVAMLLDEVYQRGLHALPLPKPEQGQSRAGREAARGATGGEDVARPDGRRRSRRRH